MLCGPSQQPLLLAEGPAPQLHLLQLPISIQMQACQHSRAMHAPSSCTSASFVEADWPMPMMAAAPLAHTTAIIVHAITLPAKANHYRQGSAVRDTTAGQATCRTRASWGARVSWQAQHGLCGLACARAPAPQAVAAPAPARSLCASAPHAPPCWTPAPARALSCGQLAAQPCGQAAHTLLNELLAFS